MTATVDRALEPSQGFDRPHRNGPDRAVLLERSTELELLGSVVASAREGRGSMVLVTGEAGIGKSSLGRSFTTRLGPEVGVLFGTRWSCSTPARWTRPCARWRSSTRSVRSRPPTWPGSSCERSV